MQYHVSSLWKDTLPADMARKVREIFSSYRGTIFFRADDIGVAGKNFTKLVQIFSKHNVPLCLAVVPAWLTRARWVQLKNLCSKSPSLWCWHQHGWTHTNHETSGKKCEFGVSRSRAELSHDILRGKSRLENIMGSDFTPAFTPPWNRCSDLALTVIKELGFSAVSRSDGAKPPAPSGLPECAVNIDLHTRKESSPVESWANLMKEFRSGGSSGTCGVMIHHQRMNDNAFAFLDILLENIVRSECSITNFSKMLMTAPSACGGVVHLGVIV
ncbi:MAG: polysaccharide deacetylase family protein [Deltaproteobacteria bacterium]|nr:polysaccharide deacetylase family protein [Deltaproteobacteria bacterium]